MLIGIQTCSPTRRRFLQSTAIASTPFILSSGILSAEVKPNDKISGGFIGMDKQSGRLMNQELDPVEKEILKNAKVKLYGNNNYIGDFLSSMKSRNKPITNGIFGAHTFIACHLLNQTYYNQKAITWDPKKNTFAKGGDPKWLTRNYRGQWKV